MQQIESFANAASPLAITVTNEEWVKEDDLMGNRVAMMNRLMETPAGTRT